MATSCKKPRFITLDLIRKRAEHNQSRVNNLQEIALHQEELLSIGPVLPKACGSTLRILLLQNNVIRTFNPNEMKYFKVLEYLNLALNNIQQITDMNRFTPHADGQYLECLRKLDLTLNFIPILYLKSSLLALSHLRSLQELFLLGNPCLDPKRGGWSCKEKARLYVIAMIPQLQYFDGEEITKAERIRAKQRIDSLELELEQLCNLYRESQEYQQLLQAQEHHEEDVLQVCGEDDVTSHCPMDRIRLSNELSEQKAEKEERERQNQPKFKSEKEIEMDQHKAIEKARQKEESGQYKQCNEGKWAFQFNEEERYLTLEISIQKHLSSSLVDVDIHPTYVSVVIKSKVLRLSLPVEVQSEASTAQRSLATGKLLIKMPKVNSANGVLDIVNNNCKSHDQRKQTNTESRVKVKSGTSSRGSLHHMMLKEANNSSFGPIELDKIVKRKENDEVWKESENHVKEVSTTRFGNANADGNRSETESDSEDECPPPLH